MILDSLGKTAIFTVLLGIIVLAGAVSVAPLTYGVIVLGFFIGNVIAEAMRRPPYA